MRRLDRDSRHRAWFAAGAVLVGASLFFFSVQSRDDRTSFVTGPAGAKWNHDRHARQAGITCTRCHHKKLKGMNPHSACWNCHYSPAFGPTKWKNAKKAPRTRSAAASMHPLCTGCHEAAAKGPRACNGCHVPSGSAGGCNACHEPQVMILSTGSHARVACSSCHGPAHLNGTMHKSRFSARVTPKRCLFCHQGLYKPGLEPFKAGFADKLPHAYSTCLEKRRSDKNGPAEDCSSCHVGHKPKVRPRPGPSTSPEPWCAAGTTAR